MQIQKVTINNFRSILHGEFYLSDYSLLIGENNTGKSNIIDALRVFYGKDNYRFSPDRDDPLIPTENEERWIEIEFKLEDGEFGDLKEEYKLSNNRLRVRKFLKQFEDRKPGIYAYEEDKLSDDLFYGAKGVQQGKLGNVIYIPAVSRLEDQTKLTGPSPLRDLLNNILNDLVQSSDAFSELQAQFDDFANDIKVEETGDARSFGRLEEEINAEISEWEMGFDLTIKPPTETDIVKNLIDYQVIDKKIDETVHASQQGQGFQRHLIFTLIRLSAKYLLQGPTASNRTVFSPDLTLILFEEPEAFLHPAQQDTLCQNLKTIAEQEEHQVLISSHSPRFASHNSLDLPAIIRLCRQDGTETLVGQIQQTKLESIFEENQQINEILKDTSFAPHSDDLKEDMEAIKYFMWLDPHRCGMFFARHVLLVEGATERVLLNYLMETGQLETPKGGIFILDCMGKFNALRFMNILGELNVSHSVLLDGDANKEPHCRVRDLIESEQNGFTKKISWFPADIEDFLEVDKAKEARRKPQHVMLKLRERRISEEKINELLTVVNDLIFI